MRFVRQRAKCCDRRGESEAVRSGQNGPPGPVATGTPHPPPREIRASFSERTVRVYQAFSSEIADRAIAAQTFKPPFQRRRMTWIKPSFTWMMYRSGWGAKPGQHRILGVDILRNGFEWALARSCLTEFKGELHGSVQNWEARLRSEPVRIQWDPERTLTLEPLTWRTIQVGLGGEAVDEYLDEWITSIEDVTGLAHEVESAVMSGDSNRARGLVPIELPYPLREQIARQIGCSPEARGQLTI